MHSGPKIDIVPMRATWRQPVGMARLRPAVRPRSGASSAASSSSSPGPPVRNSASGSTMPPEAAPTACASVSRPWVSSASSSRALNGGIPSGRLTPSQAGSGWERLGSWAG